MAVDRRTWLKLAGGVGVGATLAPAVGPAVASKAGERVVPVTITVLSPGPGRIDYRPVLSALARYIDTHLKDYALPGMTFCLADREGFSALIHAGWADVEGRVPVGPNQLFQIGSISKSLAAICILRAAQAGKLTLDQEIAALLPGAPLPATPITVRQLLIHASGLPDDAPIFPRGGDERLWTGYPPGERFSYSNTGYALLGLILERVHGKPYAEVVRDEALRPLGMAAARGVIRYADQADYAVGYWPYDQDKPFVQGGRLGVAYFTDFDEAAGCVAATPGDMAKYVRFLISAGSGQGAPLLSDADATLFTTPVIDAPVFGPKAKYALGLGVVPIEGRPCLHHTGGMMAFSSSIHVDPAAGVGAFASANARIGSYRPRDVTAYAVMLMRAAREGRPAPAAPPIKYDLTVQRASDYDGAYLTAAGEAIVLKGEGERLTLTFKGETVALRTQGADVFAVPHPRFDALLLMVERQGGVPVAAWWGNDYFAKDPAGRTPPPAPADLKAKAGFYTNNDPWVGGARVFARASGLWADGVEPLVPLPDGSYRVGAEPWGCERVRFEAVMDGRPRRAVVSGHDLLRMSDAL
jgi:CubicO group peptidase (beta-lactamase class C family)